MRTMRSLVCFSLLISASMSASAGQAFINIIEHNSVGGQPSWADVCMSNGYHRIEVKGLTNAVLARQFPTNIFFVLRAEPVDSDTIELEVADGISGITMYLERLDVGSLTPKTMATILHAIEEKGTNGNGWDGAKYIHPPMDGCGESGFNILDTNRLNADGGLHGLRIGQPSRDILVDGQFPPSQYEQEQKRIHDMSLIDDRSKVHR